MLHVCYCTHTHTPPPPFWFNEVKGYIDIAVSVGASVNLSGFVQKVASELFNLLSSSLVWWCIIMSRKCQINEMGCHLQG